MASQTKQKFVATASRLFKEKGYEATSVSEVAKAGKLPIGSLYYYFPDGKAQLGVAAIELAAADFAEALAADMAQPDNPGEALASAATGLADRMEQQGWVDGCAVAAVALEMVNRSDELQSAANQAFVLWISVIAGRLVELGVDSAEANEVASIVVSLLEGAEMMARVAASREPLDAVARRMPLLLGGVLV